MRKSKKIKKMMEARIKNAPSSGQQSKFFYREPGSQNLSKSGVRTR